MTHTPGPWIYSSSAANDYTEPSSIVSANNATLVWANLATDDDMRLMAAAPELLQICEELEDWLSDTETLDPSYHEALLGALRIAITKGKGE